MKIAMKSRTILSLIAFIAAFAISIAITPIPEDSDSKDTNQISQQKDRINSIIRAEMEKSRELEQKLNRVYKSSGEDLDQSYLLAIAAYNEYLTSMRQISTKGLPRDFARAWDKYLQAQESRMNNIYSLIDDANLNAMSAEPTDHPSTYCNLKNPDRALLKSWHEVLRKAAKYEADIPSEAYIKPLKPSFIESETYLQH